MARNIEPKPDWVDLPDDKDWREMSAQQRYYYKRKSYEKERGDPTKQHVKKKKREGECDECDEDHPACLQFHHVDSDEKEFSISEGVRDRYSVQKVQSEIEKCRLLCANCHLKLHAEKD